MQYLLLASQCRRKWCCTPLILRYISNKRLKFSSFIQKQCRSHREICAVFLFLDPLKMVPIGCTETSVENYHSTLRNIAKGRTFLSTLLYICLSHGTVNASFLYIILAIFPLTLRAYCTRTLIKINYFSHFLFSGLCET